MNKLIVRILNRLAMIFFISVIGISSESQAQNAVTLIEEKQADVKVQPEVKAQTPEEKDEELTQDNLQQILINQGIPLTPSNLDMVGSTNYTLGANDVVEISVMRHPEVSGQFVINNEGNIQYEFVGDVPVAGLTKKQLTELLSQKLNQYIISPEVNVKIVGYNSKVVYVIGEVGRPGKIYMQGDTITVREALVQAGLPLLSAKAGKSKLITPSANAKPETKNINVQKLLYQGDLRENLVMKPGDTLYIPPTILAKALRVIQPVAQPIGEAAGTGRTVTTGF